jgi:rod shape-determining protein MreD
LAASCGLAKGSQTGAMAGFIVGLLYDMVLTTPMGLCAAVFAVVGYLAGFVHTFVHESTWWSRMLASLGVSIIGMFMLPIAFTITGAEGVLTTDVFPNMTEFSNKGKYLGYLTLQFIKTVKGILPLSDRDSYIFKRIDISGFMLSELFHEAYEKLRDSVRNIMDSMYYYGSWRQLQDYNNFITENNIYKMIPSMVVTETFSKSLKGRWGLASDEDPELGKVQDLSRISYIGFELCIEHVL